MTEQKLCHFKPHLVIFFVNFQFSNLLSFLKRSVSLPGIIRSCPMTALYHNPFNTIILCSDKKIPHADKLI